MGFSERVVSCLKAELTSDENALGSVYWGARSANLAEIALSDCGDVAAWSAQEICGLFSLDSLVSRAFTDDETGSDVRRNYLKMLPGFPFQSFERLGVEAVVPLMTREQHGYLEMQLTRDGLVEEVCDIVKVLSERSGMDDAFFKKPLKDLRLARAAVELARDLNDACLCGAVTASLAKRL